MAIKHLSPFSLVFLATATFLLAGQTAARILDGDLCRKTDYPPLCKRAVKGSVSDPKLATELAVKALIDQTMGAKALAAKLGKSPKLDNCLTSYDDAIDNLKKSLDNINHKDPGSLMSNLSAVVADYETCDDAFAEAGQRSPLAATNKKSSHMASNCLALGSQIKF
ncbi:uncharacterized protein LOC111317430 [Durio zibethinus]|uniref:Uncharacterized protein LOC111317430 n=1 Tax=Durio zibethinus TaxID=66656 RepID=A0A6P6BEQ7_DURZI|nr:uncharacterized protein LOC111317430 [Durio zibethinus]